MNTPLNAILGSSIAGLCTAVGALAIFAIRRLSQRLEDALLSAAAGIMLAATFFSLILPGIAHAQTLTPGRPAAVGIVIIGILLGALLIHVLHRAIPHEHFVQGRQGPEAHRLKRVWLFIFTITLHNLPEGMAVGVGFSNGDIQAGLNLAVGIGLQNIPEGLAVAASLLAVGYGRGMAFLIASLTGLVEGVGGLFSVGALWLAGPLLPVILGVAAGAMLFIISDEIIPETHGRGNQGLATFSLLLGFVTMMFLDATLG
jgi:ZIP family zinc transporter